MGLPRAIKEHQAGNLEEATKQYERAIAQGVQAPELYQNYGALLRKSGRIEKSKEILDIGLKLYPSHIGIKRNMAVLLWSITPAKSVGVNLQILRIYVSQGIRPGDKEVAVVWANTVNQLRELDCFNWSLGLARLGLYYCGLSPQLLLGALMSLECIVNASGSSDGDREAFEAINKKIIKYWDDCDPLLKAEIRLALGGFRIRNGELGKALIDYKDAIEYLSKNYDIKDDFKEKKQALIDTNSWNYGILYLKKQDFNNGWKLYEYGLRTPATGPQLWQRALPKPFNSKEIELWKGQILTDKRLLLLEEQAIGDIMMFLTLVPSLIEEDCEIGLLLCDRLIPIYSRSFKKIIDEGNLRIWSHQDVREKRLTKEMYDYQSPIGSICQYRFTSISNYGKNLPVITAKNNLAERLKHEYKSQGAYKDQIVGVSWRGGGTGSRVQQKSLKPDDFLKILQSIEGVRFVSLQYGKCNDIVSSWREKGIDIILDEKINPLKDMESWIAQVSACDAVLSVANTTIHGAGGLGISTMCLLGLASDWRWLDDEKITRSYWYPSVGILREQKHEGWDAAIREARKWLIKGCPMPDGPAFLDV